MVEVLLVLAGVVAGGGGVAWLLKGDRTWRDLGRAMISGGGGHSEE